MAKTIYSKENKQLHLKGCKNFGLGISRTSQKRCILAEADPLRDEGLRYAELLREAGVPAEARVYPGMVHGFWQLGGVIPQGLTAIEDAARMLRSRLLSEPGRQNHDSALIRSNTR